MNIIWFSEIKWDYLKTRKQQILSRFPQSSAIYFFEPISKALPNYYSVRNFDHIRAVTIPQIRSVNSTIVNVLLSFIFFRSIINALAGLWFKIFFFKNVGTVDCIITSNVFWAKTIEMIKNKYPELPIIYDCNDNPLAFPETPSYKKYYFLETLGLSTHVIIPHNSYRDFIPGKYQSKISIIANGVDFELFQRPVKYPEALKNIDKPIIMYIGAISEWFDFQIIRKSAENTGYNFVLIGPVSPTMETEIKLLTANERITYLGPIMHEEIPNYLSEADLCIIPFVRNKLTESVLPNKMFEYAAAGKSCVLTEFNPRLREFMEYVSIASDSDEFISEIKQRINTVTPSGHMKSLAKKYDWNMISKKYYEILEGIILTGNN